MGNEPRPFRELYDKGDEAVLAEISRRKPALKNPVALEIEVAVAHIAPEQPAWGQVRMANELLRRGVERFDLWCAVHFAASRTGDDQETAGGGEDADQSPIPSNSRH